MNIYETIYADIKKGFLLILHIKYQKYRQDKTKQYNRLKFNNK